MYAISRMLTEATIDSVRNERPRGKTRLISSCDNVRHDLESLLEQIGFSSFLSLARIITSSPPRTRSKPLSLTVTAPGTAHSRGRVLLYRPSFSFVNSWVKREGRFLMAEFSRRISVFRIASVYAPNRSACLMSGLC